MKTGTPTLLIVLLVIVLGLLGLSMDRLIAPPGSTAPMRETIPALLVLGGVAGLLVFFVIAGLAFKGMGISDRTQAFGLPEGSIRAVIATMSLLLFGIVPLFLFVTLLPGPLKSISGLTQQQAGDMKSGLDGTYVTTVQMAAEPVASRTIAPLAAAGGGAVYTVYYRETPSSAATDLSKQFFTALATLVAAVSSFFFGSAVATSANKAGAHAATTASTAASANSNPNPILQSIQPNQVDASSPTRILQIAGSGLDHVTKVTLIRDGDAKTVSATDVTSNPGQVNCTLPLAADMTGKWSALVTTSDSPPKTDRLQGVFEVN